MARLIVLALVVASLSLEAWADQLILTDGRVFTGSVSVNGDTVTIVTSNATLNFPRDEVDKIDQKPTAESEYQEKLADVSM